MSSQQPPADDRKKWLTILVPAVGVGTLVVLIAVVAAMNDPATPTKPDDSGKGGGGSANVRDRRSRSDLTKLSDGTDPTAADPGLQSIGAQGLQYRDLKEGDGEVVPPGARVTVDYIGWLKSDGTMFDSSWKGGEPAEFPLSGVVKGWQEGIPGMKVGGIRKLVIPPALGYGERGAGADIPPGATLVFEVEVLGIASGR